MFGEIERGTNKAFMVEVAERSAATLLPIIRQHIKPGTTVISDEWRVYSRINAIGMTYVAVNYSINVVHQVSGAHTKYRVHMVKCETYGETRMHNVHKRGTIPQLQENIWRTKF